jgi:putative transposase
MHVMTALEVSERRACKAIGISRSTLRYVPVDNAKDDKLRSQVIELSSMYGRYGYRKITEMLNNQGVVVGKDKVYRIWREEGLKVPIKQPKRARLWLNDGSCIRQRPEYKNHVWSYDFVSDKTYSGPTYQDFKHHR